MVNTPPTSMTSSDVHESLRAVTATDGYPLQYRIWQGATADKTVLLLHGVMSHSEWFRNIAVPMASSGCKVIGADRRGCGLNRMGSGDAPSAQMLVVDTLRIIEHELDGATPWFVAGWCWGAVLALNTLSQARTPPNGVVLLAPGIFSSAKVAQNLAAERQHKGLLTGEASLSSPVREDMFTQGTWLQGYILRDNLRLRFFTHRFDQIMKEMGGTAAMQLCRLKLPLLVILAERDLVVDNDRTLKALSRMSNPLVTTSFLDCQHGMQFEVPEELVAQILPWLERHASSVCPAPGCFPGGV